MSVCSVLYSNKMYETDQCNEDCQYVSNQILLKLHHFHSDVSVIYFWNIDASEKLIHLHHTYLPTIHENVRNIPEL